LSTFSGQDLLTFVLGGKDDVLSVLSGQMQLLCYIPLLEKKSKKKQLPLEIINVGNLLWETLH